MLSYRLLNKSLISIAVVLISINGAKAGQPNSPLNTVAQTVSPVTRVALMATTVAGKRIIVAGEHGYVSYSDDNAKNWTQAKVPVSTTITALSFPTKRYGWAVGHGGVILKTSDYGNTWEKQLDGVEAAKIELQKAMESKDQLHIQQANQLVSDGPDKPFLAVRFWSDKEGLVVGAYGAAWKTDDGGLTWIPIRDQIENEKSLHLNAIEISNNSVFIAGEQGIFLKGDRSLTGFRRITTPYKGSWFGIGVVNNQIVLAGLKGNVWATRDTGKTWKAIETPMPISVNVVYVDKKQMLLGTQSGFLYGFDMNIKFKGLVGEKLAPITSISCGEDNNCYLATLNGLESVGK
jgi:photosystem II stability/assembly factor-like uncharacterized protein